MVLVDLIFNYEGEWVTHPEVVYTKNKLHTFSRGYCKDIRVRTYLWHCSAPQMTQSSQENRFSFMPTPRVGQSSMVPNFPEMEHDEDVVVRPMVISEVKTRLQLRKQVNLPAGTRSINFTGDHTSVSEPTYLPYSPAGLMWKGKAATTSNQLEKQRQQKIKKLKIRKGK
nr:uncharacterized protein LOC117277467 [Nicotiana tomentosiformis]